MIVPRKLYRPGNQVLGPLFKSWGGLKASISRQWEIWQRYETVVVFDRQTETTDRVKLPPEVLSQELDQRARYTANTVVPQVLGFFLCWLITWAILFILLLPFVYTVPASIVSGAVGFVVGGFAGVFVGPLFGPKPVWVVVRDTETREIAPVLHTHFDREYVEKDPDSGEPVPDVILATSIYDGTLAREEIEDYKTQIDSKWEKFQTIAAGLVLVCCLVVMFLTYTVSQQGTP